MGWTIKTSFCARVTLSMRSPVATSKGCAPVLGSYSAITRFTSSMSAVAGSYSRMVLSPCDENVRILAFMFGLLWDSRLASCGVGAGGLGLKLIMHRCIKMSRRLLPGTGDQIHDS